MVEEPIAFQTAVRDFHNARLQAILQEIIGHFTGRSTRLLSYDEVAKQLKLVERTDRGIHPIPVKAIAGSVSRYSDFTRTFLPRQKYDAQRWARVKAADVHGQTPPIDVYKVGEVYFVLDGNHRVSIARQKGQEQIDANVIEVKTSIPITPDIQPDELIVKAEYADFLQQTGLADLLPNVDISLTVPGQYEKLIEQIIVHQRILEQEQAQTVPFQEAVISWYDEAYFPLVSAIIESGMLRWIPDRTAADLYMWVSDHRDLLEQELGWAIRSDSAVADLVAKEGKRSEHRETGPGAWRKSRMVDRYTENLFKDLLIPLRGIEGGWDTLEQGLIVAGREDAVLNGLHVIKPGEPTETDEINAIRERFTRLCENAGVSGRFLVESGEVIPKICERALLTDLVVLNGSNPPAVGLSGLGSRLRTIIWRCARPVLTVCCNVSPLNRALLAFDNSPRSKEALFVATYLAEQWMTSLTVLAVTDGSRVKPEVLDYARAYLDLHEIEAVYLAEKGSVDTLHKVLDELDINLLLMGGYSLPAIGDMVKGSTVNYMLREMHCPIIICR